MSGPSHLAPDRPAPVLEHGVTDADEQHVRDALDGLSFPADRHTMLTYATDRGGLENHVLDALDAVPERAFHSIGDVIVSLAGRTRTGRV